MMKSASKQKHPPGWTECKIRATIAHYDKQTDAEGAAEIDDAPAAPGETWISVPTELVAAVSRLIEDYERRTAPSRAKETSKKTVARKARE